MADVELSDVKRGDAATLTLNLGTSDEGFEFAYTGAAVILHRIGGGTYTVSATIDDAAVTCDLPDTLPVGVYRGEVECFPGLHTYPSDGYFIFSVVADLNPPT